MAVVVKLNAPAAMRPGIPPPMLVTGADVDAAPPLLPTLVVPAATLSERRTTSHTRLYQRPDSAP